MSSAIPYNPDDFENNNPFAEPVSFAPSPVVVAVPNEATHDPISENTGSELPPSSDISTLEQYSPNNYTHYNGNAQYSDENHGEVDSSSHQSQTQGEQSEPASQQDKPQLTERELRVLLPERFTKKYLLKIKLRLIENNKAGNPILNFDATVNGLPKYRQSVYKEIRRTFNEVLKFNKYLTVANLEVCVPVIPLAITSYPAAGTEETKHLMVEWQEWFDRICSNPILIRDEEFLFFIENDFGYSVINSSRKTAIASGLLRKTLKQFQVPYDSYEELAVFRPLIKDSYLLCQKLYKALDRKAKSERTLATNINELGLKLNYLGEFEIIHPGMKNMWEKFSKIKIIESELITLELINEMGNFGDGIQSMIDDFYQIKEALTNRHLVMRELTTAEKDTKSKHLQVSKLKSKSSLDPLKVDEAIRSLEYSTKTEESLNLQLKRISGEMLFEKDEIINHTENKLRRMLKNFTLNKVEHHRKILKHLENIRLDIRIVDEKGGLSRLNRDNLTNLKHNLPQLQSSQGDSWSYRTFRSLEDKREEDETKDDRRLENDNENENLDKNSNDFVDAKHAASLLGVATF